jgi:hypothetical protein
LSAEGAEQFFGWYRRAVVVHQFANTAFKRVNIALAEG